MTPFMECDSCRVKPGSPPLCAGCLHNRAFIERMTPSAADKRAMTQALREVIAFEQRRVRIWHLPDLQHRLDRLKQLLALLGECETA